MIQIKQNGQVDASHLDQLHDEYMARRCVVLRELLEPKILAYLQRHIDISHMVTKSEVDGNTEFGKVLFLPEREPGLFIFRLLFNNRKFFTLLESITNCTPIGNFFGRIHTSVQGTQHQIEWHGDNTDTRLLGLTIDLGTNDYTGGVFQLRKRSSRQILSEVPRMSAGDAFVFEIAPDLQHRLTMVEGGGPRTVGVGWFRSQPDLGTFAGDYLTFRRAGVAAECLPDS